MRVAVQVCVDLPRLMVRKPSVDRGEFAVISGGCPSMRAESAGMWRQVAEIAGKCPTFAEGEGEIAGVGRGRGRARHGPELPVEAICVKISHVPPVQGARGQRPGIAAPGRGDLVIEGAGGAGRRSEIVRASECVEKVVGYTDSVYPFKITTHSPLPVFPS